MGLQKEKLAEEESSLASLSLPSVEYHEEADPNGRFPKHSYVSKKDGKLWAGVSSVSKLAQDTELSGILNQWAANCAIQDVSLRWDLTEKYTQEEKNDLLFAPKTGAKTAHLRISKDAKELGSSVHEIIENYIQKKAELKSEDKNIQRALDQFKKWEKENRVLWLASELLVSNEELELAGRLDALAYVNGKRTIIDFKVANNIGINYYIQLAGYWLCIESMGWLPEERILVRIPKTDVKKVWNGRNYDVVENNLEVIIPPTDLRFDIETFKHLRQAFKWVNQQAFRRN